MPVKHTIACSWSGGKDSCYAFMQAMLDGHKPAALLNMMNEDGRISRSHGLPGSLLRQQALVLHLPLVAKETSWSDYERSFVGALEQAKQMYYVDAAVFGDIDLQEHRDWEEMACAKAGIKALLPLWKRERKELLLEMLDCGIKSVIVSCNEALGASFLGRQLDKDLVPELEDMNVDVCGENGEFHTIVVDCPIFNRAIVLPSYSKVKHGNYHFLQWHT